jgi:hypothetical protein
MIVKLRFSHKEKKIFYSGGVIDAICDVRSLKNGRRKKNEVVKSIPSGKPYDPEPFPKGEWNISKSIPKTDKYLAPFFIPTDAIRPVKVWHLDEHGNYDAETREVVMDGGYGIHYSESNTTYGCIRVTNKIDLINLRDWCDAQIKAGFKVQIIVEE